MFLGPVEWPCALVQCVHILLPRPILFSIHNVPFKHLEHC